MFFEVDNNADNRMRSQIGKHISSVLEEERKREPRTVTLNGEKHATESTGFLQVVLFLYDYILPAPLWRQDPHIHEAVKKSVRDLEREIKTHEDEKPEYVAGLRKVQHHMKLWLDGKDITSEEPK